MLCYFECYCDQRYLKNDLQCFLYYWVIYYFDLCCYGMVVVVGFLMQFCDCGYILIGYSDVYGIVFQGVW